MVLPRPACCTLQKLQGLDVAQLYACFICTVFVMKTSSWTGRSRAAACAQNLRTVRAVPVQKWLVRELLMCALGFV
ncbi:hypothetical protein L7F22_020988, partial [Adiantum nelumboides]|nr:hypothetical protein [Adiantum nelumboides]